MEEEIRVLLEPIARDFDVDVLDIKLSGWQNRQRLRVTVDQAGGIGSDTLTRISRALSLQLDAADMISGRYELEVSSPGLNWSLETTADFRRHLGERIQADLLEGNSLTGENLGPEADGFRLRDDKGVEHHLDMSCVDRVRRQINWKESSKDKLDKGER